MAGVEDLTVVCGGGGIWGVAWMTGLIAGFEDAGIAARAAGAFIGTSAGAVTSAQFTSSLSTAALYERQVDQRAQAPELPPPAGAVEALFGILQGAWPTDAARRGAISAQAKAAKTISHAERRASIALRLSLPVEAWPDIELAITAVDLETLELTVFTARSGVSLIDAVAASCAVPGVWPPAEINGRRYIDGGVWKTGENAHLAKGRKSILILAPFGSAAGMNPALAADIEDLRAGGSDVFVLSADPNALSAMGGNPLNPETRKPGAEAGRLQAAAEAAGLSKWLAAAGIR